jgi:hypothetical protein
MMFELRVARCRNAHITESESKQLAMSELREIPIFMQPTIKGVDNFQNAFVDKL